MAQPSAIKPKLRTCHHCGDKYRTAPGRERCPGCGHYDLGGGPSGLSNLTQLLDDVEDVEADRLVTGPWDPCFGGGIVRSTVTLVGGEPGAGKSTMALQFADAVACAEQKEALYICTEEVNKEVKLRAKRLGIPSPRARRKVRLLSTLAGTEALEQLDRIIEETKPAAIVLDSLAGLTGQDLDTQVELCKLVKSYAARANAPALNVNHVTKDLEMAGLMELQHSCDCTILVTNDPKLSDGQRAGVAEMLGVSFDSLDPAPRRLRTVKNRHGVANVEVVLYMTAGGLVEMPAELES